MVSGSLSKDRPDKILIKFAGKLIWLSTWSFILVKCKDSQDGLLNDLIVPVHLLQMIVQVIV